MTRREEYLEHRKQMDANASGTYCLRADKETRPTCTHNDCHERHANESGKEMNFLEFIKTVQPSYVPDWAHLRLMAGLESGENFLAATPPGLGKSQIFSVLRPSYEIYKDPECAHIILLAHSDGFSRRTSIASSLLRSSKRYVRWS